MANDSGKQDNILAGLSTAAETAEMRIKYLTFWTEDQLFGMPIANVVQIIGIQGITKVPEFPSYAKGIINLRKNIVPIIDMRLRFGKEEVPYTERTCIIVTNIDMMLVGFVVDGVDEVAEIPPEEISDSPNVFAESENKYVTAVGRHAGKVVLLLDMANVLGDSSFVGLV